VFFGIRNGAAPLRILQSIARGLLGPAAFEGGLATAALGLFLHFFIAFVVVIVYYLASTKLQLLMRRPVLCGMLYGVMVYAFMNLVVLPLSAAGRPTFVTGVVVNGLLIHMFGVGVPSALFARAGLLPRSHLTR
jgi:hypothetical protein